MDEARPWVWSFSRRLGDVGPLSISGWFMSIVDRISVCLFSSYLLLLRAWGGDAERDATRDGEKTYLGLRPLRPQRGSVGCEEWRFLARVLHCAEELALDEHWCRWLQSAPGSDVPRRRCGPWCAVEWLSGLHGSFALFRSSWAAVRVETLRVPARDGLRLAPGPQAFGFESELLDDV